MCHPTRLSQTHPHAYTCEPTVQCLLRVTVRGDPKTSLKWYGAAEAPRIKPDGSLLTREKSARAWRRLWTCSFRYVRTALR